MMNGRKNAEQMKEKMNHDFLMMTPEALDALKDIMMDTNVNPSARVQAIGLILDRGLGKPEESIRIQNDQETMERAQKRLEELFVMAREISGEETEA